MDFWLNIIILWIVGGLLFYIGHRVGFVHGEVSAEVFECDCCHQIVALKTEDDWKKFNRDWWQGLELNFCPICCEKPETQPRLLADVRWLSQPAKEFLAKHLENC